MHKTLPIIGNEKEQQQIKFYSKLSGELILPQATKNLKIIYLFARLGACSKSKVKTTVFWKNRVHYKHFPCKIKLNNYWYSLLEQAPYILTTNVVAIYIIFIRKNWKRNQQFTKHATSDSGQAFVLLPLTRKPGLCIFMLIYFYHELFLWKISMFELDYVRIMQIVGYMNCWTLYVIINMLLN